VLVALAAAFFFTLTWMDKKVQTYSKESALVQMTDALSGFCLHR
jgi:hypothetical protein